MTFLCRSRAFEWRLYGPVAHMARVIEFLMSDILFLALGMATLAVCGAYAFALARI
jgi:hypothetical protein